jgi:hypothetical protein
MAEKHKIDSERALRPVFRWWPVYVGLLLLALFSIFDLFGGEITAAVWHWRHGNTALFQDSEIPIPQGWRATYGQDGLAIQRAPAPFDSNDAATVSITRASGQGDRRFDIATWRHAMISAVSSEDYVYTHDSTVDMGATAIHCLHFDKAKEPDRVLANCLLPDAKIFAEFKGSPKYLSALDTIIRGIKQRAGDRTSAPL